MAWQGDRAVAVVGLRALENPSACEMKRLWVDPSAQGLGLGRRLAERCVQAAQDKGYRSLCLDTLPKLDAAQTLYRSMGFRSRSRYNNNNLPGVLFYQLDLSPGATERA